MNDLTCLGHWIEDDLTFLIAKADLETQPYCYVLSNRYDSEMVSIEITENCVCVCVCVSVYVCVCVCVFYMCVHVHV